VITLTFLHPYEVFKTLKNDVNLTKLKYFRWQRPCVRVTFL